jgi:hypothetical protein
MFLLDRQPLQFIFCRAVLCVLLSSFIAPLITSGQSPLKKDSRYEVIDEAEAGRRLHTFRNQRLEGDFCFRFQLEHLPRRGSSVRYYGSMWGSWNEGGPVTRIKLDAESNDEGKSDVELILQNGPKPMAWLRNAQTDCFDLLEGAALFQPLLPEIVYTPFDFLMPFLYWSDYDYEGSARMRSRVARNFLMYPNAANTTPDWLQSVRVGIDDTYNALLHIEVMEKPGRKRSSFSVESFKKVQGQWIVKYIVMKDWKSRDRTRFKVLSASVGLSLSDAIFSPIDAVDVPLIPESMFEDL